MEQTNSLAIQFMTPIFLALLSALGMLLVQLTKVGVAMLKARVEHISIQGDIDRNTKSKQVLQRLIDLAQQKVLMLEQTVVEDLKDQVRSGKLPVADLPTAAMKVKDSAVQTVKRDADATGLWKEASEIFKGNEADLVTWLADVVESQVCQLPPSGLQTRDQVPAKFDPSIAMRG